ncbi:hypothetical protein LINPERPRIM_LOCUS23695 [Linum perenne]
MQLRMQEWTFPTRAGLVHALLAQDSWFQDRWTNQMGHSLTISRSRRGMS